MESGIHGQTGLPLSNPEIAKIDPDFVALGAEADLLENEEEPEVKRLDFP
jgi:hypothetical protein